MIFNTAADTFRVSLSIAARIRLVFLFYAILALAAATLSFIAPNTATDFHFVYRLLFSIAVVTCLFMVFKPTIGGGSLHLFPLFLGSLIRIGDIWMNYWKGDISLEVATRGSVGWSFLLVSIAYVDLLESRIYHRMVTYIEQQAPD